MSGGYPGGVEENPGGVQDNPGGIEDTLSGKRNPRGWRIPSEEKDTPSQVGWRIPRKPDEEQDILVW